MTNEQGWYTFDQIKHIAKSRSIILYGRSVDWLPKTLSKLHATPVMILDKNPNYDGTEYEGIPVTSSNKINKLNPSDNFIVITSSIFEEIKIILEKLGWKIGKDFCYSPAYMDYYQLNKMKNYKPNLLVTSSDYASNEMARSSENGGGVFHICDQYEKPICVLKGSFRQIEKLTTGFVAIEYVKNKMILFTEEGKILKSSNLEFANYMGITMIRDLGLLAVVNAGKDLISLFDLETLKFKRHIPFGHKSSGNSSYHINDCCSDGKSLYVSYFSRSGNWKKGIFDGGVVEFDLDNPSKSLELYKDLWMPHSPEFFEDELHVCDSMRGIVYKNNKTKLCQINSFLRGLAHDGSYYYVGTSENMYISRLKSSNGHFLANAGVCMVNKHDPLVRFIPFMNNMNIHDVVAK